MQAPPAVTWLPAGGRGLPSLLWAPQSRCPTGDGVVAFATDDKPEFAYDPFNVGRDFGPIDIARTVVYCRWVDALCQAHADCRALVHITADAPRENWTNTVTLCAAYLVLARGLTAEDAFRPFAAEMLPPFLDCRGESAAGSSIEEGESDFTLPVLDVIRGIQRARDLGWVDYRTFAVEEHSSLIRPEHGDMSWLLPGKAIALASPWVQPTDLDGLPVCTPAALAPYFLQNNVRLVVQCNHPGQEEQGERRRLISYDPQSFEHAGVRHVSLPFEDGGCPSIDILQCFLDTVEAQGSGFAVHCRSGLGRTATVIGAFAIRHFGFTARDFIGWARVMRPGTVHGSQQQYLVNLEPYLCPGAARPMSSLDQHERLQLLPRRELRFWALDSGIPAADTRHRPESEIIQMILQARGLQVGNAPSASSAFRAPDPAAMAHRTAPSQPLSANAAEQLQSLPQSVQVAAMAPVPAASAAPSASGSTAPALPDADGASQAAADRGLLSEKAVPLADNWSEALRYLRLLTAVQVDASSESWDNVIRCVEKLRDLSKSGQAIAPRTPSKPSPASLAQVQALKEARTSRQAAATEAERWERELREALQQAREAQRGCEQLKFRIALEREARLTEARRREENDEALANEVQRDEERMAIAEQKVQSLKAQLLGRESLHRSQVDRLETLRSELKDAQETAARKVAACREERASLEAEKRQLQRLEEGGRLPPGNQVSANGGPTDAWESAKRSVERLRERLQLETASLESVAVKAS